MSQEALEYHRTPHPRPVNKRVKPLDLSPAEGAAEAGCPFSDSTKSLSFECQSSERPSQSFLSLQVQVRSRKW